MARANVDLRALLYTLGVREPTQLEFANGILPIVDLTPYLSMRGQVDPISVNTAAITFNTFGLAQITVPAEELWVLTQVGGQCPTSTGAVGHHTSCSVVINFGATTYILGLFPREQGLVSGTTGFGRRLETPMILQGGDIVQCNFGNNDAAGTRIFTLNAMRFAIPI